MVWTWVSPENKNDRREDPHGTEHDAGHQRAFDHTTVEPPEVAADVPEEDAGDERQAQAEQPEDDDQHDVERPRAAACVDQVQVVLEAG